MTRLIEFYRQTDVELLEKAILNLNLTKYTYAEQVRHIAEEEYLSSALIHLLTISRDDVMQLPYYIEKQSTSIFES